MIFGIGTDIIEVLRIEKAILRSPRFCEKIFTGKEQGYCNSRNNAKFESYAARYAAKEAFFKALGTGYRNGFAFNDIEILNDSLGKPEVQVYGKILDFVKQNRIDKIHLSLTHVKELASAFVVLEC